MIEHARSVQIAFLACFLAAWALVTETGLVSQLFLPRLPDLWSAFVDLLLSGEFLAPLAVTLFELVVAFAGAVILGTLVGFAVSRSRFMIRTFDPLFSSIFAVPLVIFYPLALLFFGLGPASKIALGGALGFFPIVLNTISGFGHVDHVYERAARSMGASNVQLFRRVLLPAALPIILTGYRIGFVLCFLSIIGGETLGSLEGLGHEIVFYAESMNSARMFAYIVFIVVISFILNTAVLWLERRGARYK